LCKTSYGIFKGIVAMCETCTWTREEQCGKTEEGVEGLGGE